MPTFGIDSTGEFLRPLPIRYLAALPGSGDFPGDIAFVAPDLFYWDGSAWIGPLGSGGGGGGAPTGASYVVLGLNATLTAERVLVVAGGLALADSGPNGNVTITGSIARTFAHMGG